MCVIEYANQAITQIKPKVFFLKTVPNVMKLELGVEVKPINSYCVLDFIRTLPVPGLMSVRLFCFWTERERQRTCEALPEKIYPFSLILPFSPHLHTKLIYAETCVDTYLRIKAQMGFVARRL